MVTKRKPGRPKGSKNKAAPSFPVKVSELDKLKNLVGRQDDLVAQLQDNLRDLEFQLTEKNQEIDLLEKSKIQNKEFSKKNEEYRRFAIGALILSLLALVLQFAVFRHIP